MKIFLPFTIFFMMIFVFLVISNEDDVKGKENLVKFFEIFEEWSIPKDFHFIFVIDGSNSITDDDFIKMKEILVEILDLFPNQSINMTMTMTMTDQIISIVQFSNKVQVECKNKGKKQAYIVVDRMKQMNGATETGEALIKVEELFDEYPRTGRYVFLVTDGISNGGVDPIIIADRLKRNETKIFVVEVYEDHPSQSQSNFNISSGSDYFLKENTFNTFKKTIDVTKTMIPKRRLKMNLKRVLEICKKSTIEDIYLWAYVDEKEIIKKIWNYNYFLKIITFTVIVVIVVITMFYIFFVLKNWGRRGSSEHEINEYQTTIKNYERILEIEANCSTSFAERGLIYKKLGKLDQALKDYKMSQKMATNQDENYESEIDEILTIKSLLEHKSEKYCVRRIFEKVGYKDYKKLSKFLLVYGKILLKTNIPNDDDRKVFLEELKKFESVKYEGSYDNESQFHGKGCLYLDIIPSIVLYEGEFKNGQRNGRGKLFHPNSNEIIMFFGSFVNGKKEGIGFEKNLNGKIIRRGKWKEGKLIEEIKRRKDIKEIESEKMEIFMENVMNANLTIRKSYILGYGTNTIGNYTIFINEYNIVYKFTENYAFKHYHKVSASEKEIEIFKKEVGFLSNIDHSNIVKIVGVSSKTPIGILTEVCEMNVSSLIKRGVRLSFLEKVKILYQTCVGCEYIHIICIQHRDLKWHNVLITKAQPVRKVKIADFGLAKLKDSFTSTKNTFVGSIEYIAPEVLTEKYSYPSDVFSFGIMIYELLYDTLDPYDKKNNPGRKNEQVLLHLVSKANLRPKIPIKNEVDKENEWLVDVIQNCVKHRADKRPTFSEIVRTIRKNCSKCVEDILPFN